MFDDLRMLAVQDTEDPLYCEIPEVWPKHVQMGIYVHEPPTPANPYEGVLTLVRESLIFMTGIIKGLEAVPYAAYQVKALKRGLEEGNRSTYELLLKCVLVITRLGVHN